MRGQSERSPVPPFVSLEITNFRETRGDELYRKNNLHRLISLKVTLSMPGKEAADPDYFAQ
jgi:hypothetical protein